MRDLVWASEAWEDYLWWQTQDRKTLKRINGSSELSVGDRVLVGGCG